MRYTNFLLSVKGIFKQTLMGASPKGLHLRAIIVIIMVFLSCNFLSAQQSDSTKIEDNQSLADESQEALDSQTGKTPIDTLDTSDMLDLDIDELSPQEGAGFYKGLKVKFIEGNAGFMSLVAIILVLGLAFCIERIIYLTLSEIDAKKLLTDVEPLILEGQIDEAKEICRNTRGPVASICYQGLLRIDETMEDIERSITSYGSVQSANLEKGCSWITLFIAMAPSLGFLGTVVGMVMAFEQIQLAGDISPTIVASGMKVALITTIFGIICALVLQIFYNYILSKIEHLTSQMEESAISLLDAIMKYKLSK